jgi:hypothetical protein
VDATVRCVVGERAVGGTVAEPIEGSALPGGDLTSVVMEARRAESARESGEGTASINGWQLAVVADEDDFGSAGGCLVEQSLEGAGADHRGLVDNDHLVLDSPCIEAT